MFTVTGTTLIPTADHTVGFIVTNDERPNVSIVMAVFNGMWEELGAIVEGHNRPLPDCFVPDREIIKACERFIAEARSA